MFFLNWPLFKKYYLLPGDLNKQRFVIHTSPLNCELMIHTEITTGRTYTEPSEQSVVTPTVNGVMANTPAKAAEYPALLCFIVSNRPSAMNMSMTVSD